jgi:hypothetical protein
MTKQQLDGLRLTCLRCRHSWLRRVIEDPKQCPACRTRLWNTPRVRKISNERKAACRG